MTAHAHDPSTHRDSRPAPATAGARTTSALSRWLLPALALGIVAAGLVVAGVVPLSTVLYAGLFGGMLLMHLGGHGGHGGHAGHGSGTTPAARDLRTPSSGAQVRQSGSGDEIDDGTLTNESRHETDDHDKHSSHVCH
jgi:hypothetical protein